MRKWLTGLFAAILIAMTCVTLYASSVRPIWDNAHLLADPWFLATLSDAYCAFVTFFVWVACREHTWPRRGGWFLAIMVLGNFAMATYVLLQLSRLKPGQPVSNLLQPRKTR